MAGRAAVPGSQALAGGGSGSRDFEKEADAMWEQWREQRDREDQRYAALMTDRGRDMAMRMAGLAKGGQGGGVAAGGVGAQAAHAGGGDSIITKVLSAAEADDAAAVTEFLASRRAAEAAAAATAAEAARAAEASAARGGGTSGEHAHDGDAAEYAEFLAFKRQKAATGAARGGDANGDGWGAVGHGAELIAQAQADLMVGHPTGGRAGVQLPPGVQALTPPGLTPPGLTPPALMPPGLMPPALTPPGLAPMAMKPPAVGSFASMLAIPGAPETLWGHAGGGSRLGFGGVEAEPTPDNSRAVVAGLGAPMPGGAAGDRGVVGGEAFVSRRETPAPGGKADFTAAEQSHAQQKWLHYRLALQAAAGARGSDPTAAAELAVGRAQQLDDLIQGGGTIYDPERITLHKALRILARLVQPGRGAGSGMGFIAAVIAETEESGAGLAELPRAAKDWQTLVRAFRETMAHLTTLIAHASNTGDAMLSTAAMFEKALINELWKELEDYVEEGNKYGTLKQRLEKELSALCRQDDRVGIQAIFGGKGATATGTAAAEERLRKLIEENKELKSEAKGLRNNAKRIAGADGGGAAAAAPGGGLAADSPAADKWNKDNVCFDFQKGNCRRPACKFAHTYIEK